MLCISFTKKWLDPKWLPTGGCARRDEGFVFFKVAEGYGGHTQNLAFIDATNRMFLETKSQQLSSDQTTLHHIALKISLEDFESEKMRLYTSGCMFGATAPLYLPDPERCPEPVEGGNLLEFVC